jgi:hypothetical protein
VGSATPAESCERTYKVGSNIPTRECAPVLTEAERQRNAEEFRNAVRPAPPITSGGG